VRCRVERRLFPSRRIDGEDRQNFPFQATLIEYGQQSILADRNIPRHLQSATQASHHLLLAAIEVNSHEHRRVRRSNYGMVIILQSDTGQNLEQSAPGVNST